jgi:ABC-type nitrate/sulfonate/bicarbonate transport system permease component
MRRLRQLHLYLGCIFAPALLFFAITGSWQIYRLQDTAKDGSYTAPAALETLSAIHVNGHLPGLRQSVATPMHGFALAAAVGLIVTTLLGVVMAFRFSRSSWVPAVCLLAGLLIPAAILYFFH